MEEISKEQLEAIERARKQVVEEVQDHQDADKDLQDAVGGTEEPLWEISLSYKTSSST